jgi:hypothetical protein
MLEAGPQLATWSLSEPPAAGASIPARAIPDHRLAYLDYEGEVSGGRGSVTRWDHGEYELLHRDPTEWIVLLSGTRLTGRVTLRREAEPSGGGDRWQLAWEEK